MQVMTKAPILIKTHIKIKVLNTKTSVFVHHAEVNFKFHKHSSSINFKNAISRQKHLIGQNPWAYMEIRSKPMTKLPQNSLYPKQI